MPKILEDIYQVLEHGKTPTAGERPGDNSSSDPEVKKLVKEYWRSYWANNAFTNLINHLG